MTTVYLRNLYTEDEGWYPCDKDHPDAVEFVPATRLAAMRAALQIIAGSSDRLQALQAAAALDNIGPP